MKGRHCPQLLGPKRQPRQGVNADAAASQVVFITLFMGSQPGWFLYQSVRLKTC